MASLSLSQVSNKVEESKEKCAEVCNDLVSAACSCEDFSLYSLQVKVICESREDWWNALLAWLRSLGGSKGICDFLKHLLDSSNYLLHLVHCNLDSNPNPSECSNTFVANQLAWLKEQDGVNTEELNFATKCLLAIVVTIGHLVLFALILTLLLGLPSYLAVLNIKAKEVLAMRTISTRRASPASKTRSRKSTPAKKTRSKSAKRSSSLKVKKNALLLIPVSQALPKQSSSSEELVKIVIEEDIRKRPASSSKKFSSS